jgi:hypothetical protein
MATCRECKKTFNEFLTGRPREYCSDACMKAYNRRAAKIRRGLIAPHVCSTAAQHMQACIRCPDRPWTADNPACRRCHENHSSVVCGRSHRAPFNGGRLRRVCPADCRACPHGATADRTKPAVPRRCPTCGQVLPNAIRSASRAIMLNG